MKDRDLAVALSYDPDRAEGRRGVAKGRGAPRDHGGAGRQDRDLAALLSTLEIDRPIPIAALAAVAEIRAHLCRANRALRGEAR